MMDALDLEIDAHKYKEGCQVCGNTMRGFSVASIAPAGKHARRVSEGITKDACLSYPPTSARSYD
jgi:hypothetical protein